MSNLKKYTGDRRRTNPVRLSGDKMAIAAIGIIITCIFLVRSMANGWGGNNEKSITLAYTDYYQPSNAESNQDVLKLVQALNKMNNLTCPTTKLRAASRTLTTGVKGTVAETPARVFLCTSNYVDTSDAKTSDGDTLSWVENLLAGPMANEVSSQIKDGEANFASWNISTEMALWNTFNMRKDIGAVEYTPIVAPFQFKFANANTDGKTIRIVSDTTGDVKYELIFRNVVSWFCAAPMEGDISYDTLKEHIAHGTPLGLGDQSYVQGGFAGAIIGFADENTTVEVIYYDKNGYHTESIAALYGHANPSPTPR